MYHCVYEPGKISSAVDVVRFAAARNPKSNQLWNDLSNSIRYIPNGIVEPANPVTFVTTVRSMSDINKLFTFNGNCFLQSDVKLPPNVEGSLEALYMFNALSVFRSLFEDGYNQDEYLVQSAIQPIGVYLLHGNLFVASNVFAYDIIFDLVRASTLRCSAGIEIVHIQDFKPVSELDKTLKDNLILVK